MSTKICLDCMPYIRNKMTAPEQVEAVASIFKTTNVPEDVISGAILVNDIDCTLDDVKKVLSKKADIPYCQEYLKKIGYESICKLCEFSTICSQNTLEQEERLLHICIKDREQFNRLLEFLNKNVSGNTTPESYAEEVSDKLFHAEYMLSCQNAEKIVLIQLYRMMFLSLLKKPKEEKNITEYLQSSIDKQISHLHCDEIMQRKYYGEIERIVKLKTDVAGEDVLQLAETLLKANEEPTTISTAPTNSLPTATEDDTNDMEFLSWSCDEDAVPETKIEEPEEKTDSEVSIPDGQLAPEEEPEKIDCREEKETEDVQYEPTDNPEEDICVSDYLNKNGFLYNQIVMPDDAKYTYVSNSKDELMLKYAIMLDTDIAIEPATWKENGKQGLLFYFFIDKYYYFLPFENMHDIAYYAIKGVLTESYHTIYTMISIPLFYRLFTLGMEEINVLSLYDLYSVVNGEPCEEPYNIVRMVTTEFEKNAETYLPYTMQFYKSIAKKYMHRCDKKHKKEIAQLSYQNHTISMSYSLKKVCNIQQTYLSFAHGECSFACQDIEAFTLDGKRLHISYKNPVDNTSRYTNAFRQIMQKLYTCKVYKNCRYYILDVQDDYMEIYVSEKSREEFLSILHHLLIKAGQRYISDVPHVEIIS